MSTTAEIAKRGCTTTGITEDMASTLHDNLGKTLMAVVEIQATSRGENLKGDEKVVLSILNLEPAPNKATEDHLRELSRSFHYERKLLSADQQLQIETGDDIEPKVSDVLAAGKALEPHDYEPDPDGPDGCNICGQGDDATIHHVHDPADPANEDDKELTSA